MITQILLLIVNFLVLTSFSKIILLDQKKWPPKILDLPCNNSKYIQINNDKYEIIRKIFMLKYFENTNLKIFLQSIKTHNSCIKTTKVCECVIFLNLRLIFGA